MSRTMKFSAESQAAIYKIEYWRRCNISSPNRSSSGRLAYHWWSHRGDHRRNIVVIILLYRTLRILFEQHVILTRICSIIHCHILALVFKKSIVTLAKIVHLTYGLVRTSTVRPYDVCTYRVHSSSCKLMDWMVNFSFRQQREPSNEDVIVAAKCSQRKRSPINLLSTYVRVQGKKYLYNFEIVIIAAAHPINYLSMPPSPYCLKDSIAL